MASGSGAASTFSRKLFNDQKAYSSALIKQLMCPLFSIEKFLKSMFCFISLRGSLGSSGVEVNVSITLLI